MPELIPSFERVVEQGSRLIVDAAKKLDEAIGERPFGAEKLPEIEQVRRYLLIRPEPAAWAELIAQHGHKATVRHAQRMEGLVAKYPEAAAESDAAALLLAEQHAAARAPSAPVAPVAPVPGAASGQNGGTGPGTAVSVPLPPEGEVI